MESSEILGLVLRKVIGPYGLDIIAEYFVFSSSFDEQNFDVLLKKLDTFFYLRCFPRNKQKECIKEYIDRLKVCTSLFLLKLLLKSISPVIFTKCVT